MERFAALFESLDRSTATLDKRAALVDYFANAPAADAAWALHVLSGGRIARVATTTELRQWVAEATELPSWLVEASHAQAGDLAETLTLLIDDPAQADASAKPAVGEPRLSELIEKLLLPLRTEPPDIRRTAIVNQWRSLPRWPRLVFNKLLTGALRVGVSKRLVQQAIADLTGLDIAVVAQRMMGGIAPTASALNRLLDPAASADDRQRPFPFYLASPLTDAIETLGPIEDWLLEWKWDGIRLQLLQRSGETALWSRGEERLDGRFPELESIAAALPDGCVIDGELLPWRDGRVQAFASLQKRIGRLKPGAKVLREHPVALLAYDLLEFQGEDLREAPLIDRRRRLEAVLGKLDAPTLGVSPRIALDSWEAAAALRESSRERGVEGLMLKRLDSPYREGRRRGDWWKWKVDPLVIDAVLIYAQSGSGRRATLFTDYTFALWDGDTLVPVAKAYSGLVDAEIAKLDKWIRQHTKERFGPVRSVEPFHVFELAFEAVQPSARHKSGVAVRFPRIARWRIDKRAEDADQLSALRALAALDSRSEHVFAPVDPDEAA